MAEPLLLRWQGLLHPSDMVLLRLEWLSGSVLTLLLAGLPLFTRGGLSLVIAAVALLWLLWSVCSPPEKIGPISGCCC